MKVAIFNTQSDLKISRTSVKALAKEVTHFEGKSFDEVAIHFVNIQKISQLHLQFFNDPTPTDCISFPIDNTVMGDVFVCPQIAFDYATSHRKDPYHEITLYVIHGLLHLMGYDDIETKQRAKMRRAERRHLLHIGNLGLWLHP